LGSAPANLNDSGAQLLTLFAACVHERRHRGVTPTIDDIPDNPAATQQHLTGERHLVAPVSPGPAVSLGIILPRRPQWRMPRVSEGNEVQYKII
jgi:hypothetical protein